MFKEMRRVDKMKSDEDAAGILKEGTNGVLSLTGLEGYPYGVPVSYVYEDGKIYFHSFTAGHKIEAIKNNPKVSFCVVGADDVAPEKFTTIYKSVICFGQARIVETDEEKKRILEIILKKYSSDFMEGGMKYIKANWENCCCVEITVEHMSAKGLAM